MNIIEFELKQHQADQIMEERQRELETARQETKVKVLIRERDAC